MSVSTWLIFLQPCITLFSLMTPVTEVDLQSEPTSPSAVSLEITEASAFPLHSKLPPPAGLTKLCSPPFPVLSGPPSTSPWELPDEAVAPIHPGPARAMSVPPALQAAPKDYATHKPPLSAPVTGPDALSSWAQSQWIAFNDAFVPCRGLSHQPARPRSCARFSTAQAFLQRACWPIWQLWERGECPLSNGSTSSTHTGW